RDGEIVGRGHIRGGKTHLTAAFVTLDHDTVDGMKPVQRVRRGGDVAVSDQTSHVRRRPRLYFTVEREAVDGETLLDALLSEERHITGGLGTEPEVLTDHHRCGAEGAHHHAVHELLRRPPRHLLVERENEDMVGTRLLE